MLCSTDQTKRLLKPIGLGDNDHISLSLDNKGKVFQARLYTPGENGNKPTFPSYRSHKAIARIPERKALTSKDGVSRYHLGITDYTVELVQANFKDRIFFRDEETRVVFMNILLRSYNYDQIAKRTAKYFESKTVPGNNLKIADGFEMTCYQQVAAINSALSDGYGLFFKQGCGKTLVAISLISSFAKYVKEKTGYMHRSLIICPNNVRLNWKKEIERFCDCSVKATIIEGSLEGRIRALIRAFHDNGHDATVCIIGYDTIPVFWTQLQCIDWNIGVLDESQYIKSHLTTRWQYIEKLRDKCEKRLALTGTPIANTLLDLYTQFEWIGKGCSGFTSFSAFKDFHAVFDDDFRNNGSHSDGIQKLVGFQNVPFLQERLARHSFIITLEQALPDLPERTFDIIESTMTKEQEDVYKQLASQLIVEIEGSDFTNTLTTNHILTKLLRLSEITAGYAKWDGRVCEETGRVLSTITKFFDPIPKLETLVEILKEKGPDEKTLVWSSFIAPIKKISERLTIEGIDHVTFYGATSSKKRQEAEERFNGDPKCKVWVGNPAAGGVGLNLVGYDWWNGDDAKLNTNTTQAIYYCTNWSSLDRDQSSFRPHRKGTRVPVRTTDIVVPNSIDEHIRLVVVEKQIAAMELSDLRSVLKSVLNMDI